jgi:hypothetical protein
VSSSFGKKSIPVSCSILSTEAIENKLKSKKKALKERENEEKKWKLKRKCQNNKTTAEDKRT